MDGTVFRSAGYNLTDQASFGSMAGLPQLCKHAFFTLMTLRSIRDSKGQLGCSRSYNFFVHVGPISSSKHKSISINHYSTDFLLVPVLSVVLKQNTRSHTLYSNKNKCHDQISSCYQHNSNLYPLTTDRYVCLCIETLLGVASHLGSQY